MGSRLQHEKFAVAIKATNNKERPAERVENNDGEASIEIDFINTLNDHCLLEIFKRVPIYYRLQLDLVCKRWNHLNTITWSDIKKFDCGHDYIFPLTVAHKLRVKKTMVHSHTVVNGLTLCKFCAVYIMPITFQKFHALRELKINKYNFDNAQMYELTRITGLVHLDLAKSHLKNGAEFISNLVNLEYLNIDEATGVVDDAIISIANNCKQLQYLNISYCIASEIALCELAKLPKLKSLIMECVEEATDIMFTGMRQLKHLVCRHCYNVTSAGIVEVFRNCPHFRYLEVFECDIDNYTVLKALKETFRSSNYSFNGDVMMCSTSTEGAPFYDRK